MSDRGAPLPIAVSADRKGDSVAVMRRGVGAPLGREAMTFDVDSNDRAGQALLRGERALDEEVWSRNALAGSAHRQSRQIEAAFRRPAKRLLLPWVA